MGRQGPDPHFRHPKRVYLCIATHISVLLFEDDYSSEAFLPSYCLFIADKNRGLARQFGDFFSFLGMRTFDIDGAFD